MNHTPGPWKACLNEPLITVPGHLIKTDDEVERPIASLWEGGGTEGKPTQIANAKLIAAAPDLLEACRMAREELVFGGDWATASAKIEAAIAKATK